MVTAVSAVANGGELLQPRIVRAVVKDGVRLPVPRKILGRAISKDTAARLTPMLEAVVTDGTGKQAAVADYTMAGKTGTAKKLVNGSYKGHSNYNVSFVGFVPSRKPKFTIVVVVDSPHGVSAYGGTVAAPIFQRIAEQALRHYGVQRTIDAPPPLDRRAPAAAERADAGRGTVRTAQRAAGGGNRFVGSGRARSDRHERPRRGAHAGDAGPAGAARRAWPGHGSAPAAGNAGRGRDLGPRVARSPGARGRTESARPMTVRALLRSVAALVPAEARAALDAPGLDTPCTGVVYDSRAVTPGSVFVALQGLRADGAAFAPQAVAAGAAVIVAGVGVPPVAGAAWLPVGDPRLALALLAAEFNGHPSRAMRLVGITGTNGKTTTAYLVRAILEAAGIKCGLMGTVAYRIGDRTVEAARTTPEAPEVQGFLREMVDEACGACVMEVSSHALALRRVDGLQFAAGIFTNLTRDHLDFHGNMESYFAAKRRLFEMLPPTAPAVVNLDDPARRGARRGRGHARHLRHRQAGRRLAGARCRSRSTASRSTSGRRRASRT